MTIADIEELFATKLDERVEKDGGAGEIEWEKDVVLTGDRRSKAARRRQGQRRQARLAVPQATSRRRAAALRGGAFEINVPGRPGPDPRRDRPRRHRADSPGSEEREGADHRPQDDRPAGDLARVEDAGPDLPAPPPVELEWHLSPQAGPAAQESGRVGVRADRAAAAAAADGRADAARRRARDVDVRDVRARRAVAGHRARRLRRQLRLLRLQADLPVVGEGWNWAKRDARFAAGSGPDGRPARRRAGKTVPLDRWVHVWPELGVAFVVGLTHRSEGWRDTYTQAGEYGWDSYTETALVEHERFSLYELRKDLRARSFIVPVWATEPLPEHELELAARGLAVA
jgi:hypothetical protein